MTLWKAKVTLSFGLDATVNVLVAATIPRSRDRGSRYPGTRADRIRPTPSDQFPLVERQQTGEESAAQVDDTPEVNLPPLLSDSQTGQYVLGLRRHCRISLAARTAWTSLAVGVTASRGTPARALLSKDLCGPSDGGCEL